MTFNCPRCPKTYSLRKTLAVHLHDKHPEEAADLLKESDARTASSRSPLLPLLDAWRMLPEWHPQRQTGLQVLRYLLEQRIPASNPLKTDVSDTFATPPSIIHLEEDVLASKDMGIIATNTSSVAGHLTLAHFHASLRAVETQQLWGMNPTQLCAANMIFPSEHGLQRCDPFHAPWRNEHGAPAHGNVLGSFAYCPKGHITDLHQDSLFEGRFFTVLFGRKLFLTWPPSAHNLHVYSEIHGSFSGFALPTLLPRLQNLYMTLCTHGAVGYMPPGTIHAVLNIDTAATFAYDVVHSRMLPDITRLCAWEQDVARHLLVSEDHADTVNSIRREHKDGMKLWTNLALVSDSKDVRDAVRNLLSLRHQAPWSPSVP